MTRMQKFSLFCAGCALVTPCFARLGRGDFLIIAVPFFAIITFLIALVPLTAVEWKILKKETTPLLMINAGAAVGAVALYALSVPWLLNLSAENHPYLEYIPLFWTENNIDVLTSIAWLFVLFFLIKSIFVLYAGKNAREKRNMLALGLIVSIVLFLFFFVVFFGWQPVQRLLHKLTRLLRYI